MTTSSSASSLTNSAQRQRIGIKFAIIDRRLLRESPVPYLDAQEHKQTGHSVIHQPGEPPVADTGARTVRIELFGMPRVVAGMSAITLKAGTIGTALDALTDQVPALESQILNADGTRLNAGYTFVVDGAFTSDPDYPISPESEILLVSRASGG
jgi:molybdopterin converting factor small subunit